MILSTLLKTNSLGPVIKSNSQAEGTYSCQLSFSRFANLCHLRTYRLMRVLLVTIDTNIVHEPLAANQIFLFFWRHQQYIKNSDFLVNCCSCLSFCISLHSFCVSIFCIDKYKKMSIRHRHRVRYIERSLFPRSMC